MSSAAPPPGFAPPPIFVPPNEDEKNLRLLSIFHYVVGGLNCLGGGVALIYLAMGIFLLNAPDEIAHPEHGDPFPAQIAGWVLIGLGGFAFLLAETLGACTILAGRKLAQRRGYRFAFVVACVECILFPLGTILGVFTLITLTKDSVKRLFNDGTPAGQVTTTPPSTSQIG